ncbi:MAG: SH3 domain-containing protein, partial [Acetatifactor sp.]|nr:SH3 domain-containing protein [Acetatifactor sp.]
MRETDKTRIQLKAMAMIVAAMMAMVLMFGFMKIVSHAEEVTVTATSVKIRSSADVNSGMIGGAMAGEKLQVTGEVTGADNYTWYQVTGEFENGATVGYVRSDCVSKTGSTGTTTPA